MNTLTTNLEVQPTKNLETFVSLPHYIYRNDANWPGQNDLKEMHSFDSKYKYTLRYHNWQLFSAFDGERVVGRICVSIWPAFNRRWNKRVAFFSYFECVDDQTIADKLFEAARKWAKMQGMRELWGPITFNLEGTLGLLIKGFSQIPTYGMAYNPPYYETLCEKHGFCKEKDFYEMKYSAEIYRQCADNLKTQVAHLIADPAYRIRPVQPHHLKKDIRQILDVQNQSIFHHWGSGPMELDETLQKYQDICDNIGPKGSLLVVEHQNRIIGFTLFHQDQNQLLHAARLGKAGKAIRLCGNTIGILPEYQSKKIGAWLVAEVAQIIAKYGYEEVQIGWILEDNTPSLRICTSLGGEIDKIFRVYSIFA